MKKHMRLFDLRDVTLLNIRSGVPGQFSLALLLLLTLAFIMLSASDMLVATAQSEKPAPNAASPSPSPSQARATKEANFPSITGTIKGRLVSSDGQPLVNANITVQAVTGTPSMKPTHPDADGRFTFEELAPYPDQLVDAISNTFLRGQMPAAMKTSILAAINGVTDNRTRARNALYLAGVSSQYQVER